MIAHHFDIMFSTYCLALPGDLILCIDCTDGKTVEVIDFFLVLDSVSSIGSDQVIGVA